MTDSCERCKGKRVVEVGLMMIACPDCKPSEGAVSDELLGRLFVAMCASCSCLTKTPDPKYHKLDCLFRILNDAHDRLVSNLATIARQAGEIKHLELQLEHPRKEDQDFIAELQARIRSLEAELAQAQLNERRYLWLREWPARTTETTYIRTPSDPWVVRQETRQGTPTMCGIHTAALDAAIDAAMAEAKS